ncbi:hypothetical protein FOMPIDRAFT_160112 [Fomitopsis schrenkii]|uniref:Uncharacterized protein n=1 Tax=Fomitopsis schrenkii TaxID=2126942 RepID=S8EL46_FOMSC|nr:hypothetical protein FOMPIDRAFT_160112 [Fomitopsis schrenkii]
MYKSIQLRGSHHHYWSGHRLRRSRRAGTRTRRRAYLTVCSAPGPSCCISLHYSRRPSVLHNPLPSPSPAAAATRRFTCMFLWSVSCSFGPPIRCHAQQCCWLIKEHDSRAGSPIPSFSSFVQAQCKQSRIRRGMWSGLSA